MLKGVYCGLALGLLAAMAWAKPLPSRCQPAKLQQIAWAVANGQLTTGRAANLADAAQACAKPPSAARPAPKPRQQQAASASSLAGPSGVAPR